MLVLASRECARIVRARPQTCIELHSGVIGGSLLPRSLPWEFFPISLARKGTDNTDARIHTIVYLIYQVRQQEDSRSESTVFREKPGVPPVFFIEIIVAFRGIGLLNNNTNTTNSNNIKNNSRNLSLTAIWVMRAQICWVTTVIFLRMQKKNKDCLQIIVKAPRLHLRARTSTGARPHLDVQPYGLPITLCHSINSLLTYWISVWEYLQNIAFHWNRGSSLNVKRWNLNQNWLDRRVCPNVSPSLL